jgi:hypothetical protein
MDRMLAIIIIFLGITFSLAAVLAMGAVPAIFQNKDTLNVTKEETQNQTEIIVKQFQRDNNTTQKILQNQNKSLSNQALLLEQNHNDILVNQHLSQRIDNITNDILIISKEHKIVAKDHDAILIEAQNTTNKVESELHRYGENSINMFEQIVKNQIHLNQTLHQILDKLNANP